MRKSDVFSIITNSTRSIIIRRLAEAGKAAYSDLLDSADHIHPLNSTGNFNYHLNFLLKNALVAKEGAVYRLTDSGREVARFVKDIDQRWRKLEQILRGDNMSVFSFAEDFEEETGIKMEKEVSDFKGVELIKDEKRGTFTTKKSQRSSGLELIMDEKRVIGIIPQEDNSTFFPSYELLDIEDFRMRRMTCDKKKEGKKKQTVALLSHPELSYYLSPKLLGIVQDYLERTYGESHVYALKGAPAPFLIRAKKLGKDYNGCSFVIAPSVFDKTLLKKPA